MISCKCSSRHLFDFGCTCGFFKYEKKIPIEQENYFIATLGVYAIWILTHGKNLPVDEICVENLKAAYSRFYDDDHEGMGVILAVDEVIRILNWEPVGTNYESALKRYNLNRQGLLDS